MDASAFYIGHKSPLRGSQGTWAREPGAEDTLERKDPTDSIFRCSICRQSRQRFTSGSVKGKCFLVPHPILQNAG